MALSTQRASTSLPSSSESPVPQWKYDVFLSFRGEDTRKGFVSHLYEELQNRSGIKTFRDDKELEPGTAISPNLLMAIEESRSAIIVLSPNYASSAWCLGELTKIVECMEDNCKRTIVFPIFYDVKPTDVRNQRGIFAEAFITHEEIFCQDKDLEKVKQWRASLTKVANLSGFDSNIYGSDRELVKDVVEVVCSNLRPTEIEYTISTEDFVAFEATKLAMDKVMDALRNDEFTTIGVYGMGGVGKTSLAKHVAAQSRRLGLFDYVIMAVVSQSPDFINIQGTLAELLRFNLVEKTEIGRAARLMEKMLRRNRILIILDDIWERIDLSRIGIPSCKDLQRCNSKVLLTTRRLNVCHSMESQQNIHLQVLSEDDAWDLFVNKARKSFENSTNLYNVARMVAKECAGLPVALITVARTLADKGLDDWKEAAHRLKVAQSADPEDARDVFQCIKLSYDYLRPDAKSFFLLCSLFPEDFDIPIEDLLMYGIGTGLFQDIDTIKEARVKAHSLARYLKFSSLLLDSECYGCVRMHDVIRDVAISISLSEDSQRFLIKAGCQLNEWPAVTTNAGYSAISLMRNEIQKLPYNLVCSKLQMLLLRNNLSIYEIPKTFLQRSNELRVLDLSSTSILILPASFRFLTNLQALYLDECRRLSDVSILRKLKNLEILSMKKSCLKEFPQEIGQLINLKMLDVTDAYFRVVPSKALSKLHGLQELYMKCNFSNWGSSTEEWGLFSFYCDKNAGFEELTGLACLNSLEVDINDVVCLPKKVWFRSNWVNFTICFGNANSRTSYFDKWDRNFRPDPRQHLFPFRYMSLNTTMNTLPDWFINLLTNRTEILEYQWCMGLDNLLVEYDCGKLHSVKSLAINGCPQLKVLMNSRTRVPKKIVFESLEELHLSYVPFLMELCVGELPPGSLRSLKVLNVSKCSRLVSALLPSNLWRRLQNLEILNCDDMRGMEYVFGSEGLEDEEWVFTKLTEIKLYRLKDLISIWNGPAPNEVFRNLKSLTIRGCHKLKNLLTFNVAQCLLQLELLWVEECSGLDRVFEPRNETEIDKLIVIPNLKGICLKRLPRLRWFCSSTSGSSTVDHFECPALQLLYVFECPRFSTSASDFHSRNQIQEGGGYFEFQSYRLWESRFKREGLLYLI